MLWKLFFLLFSGRPELFRTSEDPVLLDEPKLLEIANKYNKSEAQILIRFQIQLGNVVIPKSANKKRLIDNINVFDFQLNDEDMKEMQSFKKYLRCYSLVQDNKHPEYPFHED